MNEKSIETEFCVDLIQYLTSTERVSLSLSFYIKKCYGQDKSAM